MLRKFVSHIRHQWMGALALFLVLGGGTAYAVTQIDRNSVKSRHIVNDQVKSVDVRDDTLQGGGLQGSDIREATLASVPDAGALDGKDSGDFLSDDVVVRKANVAVLPGQTSGQFRNCNPGELALGGGFDFAGNIKFSGPAPSEEGSTPTSWLAMGHNPTSDSTQTLVVYVICTS
jgi:hypothetical protein